MVRTPVMGPPPLTLTNIKAVRKKGNERMIVMTVLPITANLPTMFFAAADKMWRAVSVTISSKIGAWVQHGLNICC